MRPSRDACLSGFTPIEQRPNGWGLDYRVYEHPRSGLRICGIQMPGWKRKYASFHIPYGGAHLQFHVPGDWRAEGEHYWQQVPAGTAHYLEHCVFSRDEQGGLMGAFGRLGIQMNAYTAYEYTRYYFSCVDHFEAGLALYAQALFNLKPTQERIEAERGIILSEYWGYMEQPQDQIDRRAFECFLYCHPMRTDLCGSEFDIHAISERHLKQVIEAFYRPDQVDLCLVGDLDWPSICAQLDACLPDRPPQAPGVASIPAEPWGVPKAFEQMELTLPTPQFQVLWRDPDIGFGQPVLSRPARYRRVMLANLLATCLTGETSAQAQQWKEKGLVNETLSLDYTLDDRLGFWRLTGESKDPERAVDTLLRDLKQAFTSRTWAKTQWELERRALMGRQRMLLDTVEGCASCALAARQVGLDLADWLTQCLDALHSEEATLFSSLATPQPGLQTILYAGRRNHV